MLGGEELTLNGNRGSFQFCIYTTMQKAINQNINLQKVASYTESVSVEAPLDKVHRERIGTFENFMKQDLILSLVFIAIARW